MKALVLIEQRDGKLRESSLEAVVAATKITAEVEAVVIGEGVASIAEQISKYGVKKTYVADDANLKHYHPLAYAEVIGSAIKEAGANVVMGLSSPLTKDLLAFVAGKNGYAAVTDVTEIKAESSKFVCQKPMYAGKTIATVELDAGSHPAVIGVRPKAFSAQTADGGSADTQALSVSPVESGLSVVGHQTVAQDKVDLTEADVIISGGVSMGSAEKFKILEECADVLGATVGASRAAVNEGYASHDMQVGQTGKTVSPQLYIACGISGAIQHMAGMRTSKTIVAINTNPDAAIFNIADFGIVADLFEVVPALTAKLKEVL